jgi:hypothetical protein
VVEKKFDKRVKSLRKDCGRGSEEFQNDRFDHARDLVRSLICFSNPKEVLSFHEEEAYHTMNESTGINTHLLVTVFAFSLNLIDNP